MEWYYILFICVFSLFIIKTIIAWVFGDLDVDFDLDGDIDFDISSMFSFKGILHFLMGFSSYLSAIAYFDTNKFSILDYIIAICIGILFSIILWYLYKLMMKFNHVNSSNPDFTGCECVILTDIGGGLYDVLIKTSSGTLKKTLEHINRISGLPIGTNMIVSKDITNNKYVIS